MDPIVPTSLIDAASMAEVTSFAANAKPTVIQIIGVIVPATLGVWVIGLGVKKGLSRLMKAVARAI